MIKPIVKFWVEFLMAKIGSLEAKVSGKVIFLKGTATLGPGTGMVTVTTPVPISGAGAPPGLLPWVARLTPNASPSVGALRIQITGASQLTIVALVPATAAVETNDVSDVAWFVG